MTAIMASSKDEGANWATEWSNNHHNESSEMDNKSLNQDDIHNQKQKESKSKSKSEGDGSNNNNNNDYTYGQDEDEFADFDESNGSFFELLLPDSDDVSVLGNESVCGTGHEDYFDEPSKKKRSSKKKTSTSSSSGKKKKLVKKKGRPLAAVSEDPLPPPPPSGEGGTPTTSTRTRKIMPSHETSERSRASSGGRHRSASPRRPSGSNKERGSSPRRPQSFRSTSTDKSPGASKHSRGGSSSVPDEEADIFNRRSRARARGGKDRPRRRGRSKDDFYNIVSDMNGNYDSHDVEREVEEELAADRRKPRPCMDRSSNKSTRSSRRKPGKVDDAEETEASTIPPDEYFEDFEVPMKDGGGTPTSAGKKVTRRKLVPMDEDKKKDQTHDDDRSQGSKRSMGSKRSQGGSKRSLVNKRSDKKKREGKKEPRGRTRNAFKDDASAHSNSHHSAGAISLNKEKRKKRAKDGLSMSMHDVKSKSLASSSIRRERSRDPDIKRISRSKSIDPEGKKRPSRSRSSDQLMGLNRESRKHSSNSSTGNLNERKSASKSPRGSRKTLSTKDVEISRGVRRVKSNSDMFEQMVPRAERKKLQKYREQAGDEVTTTSSGKRKENIRRTKSTTEFSGPSIVPRSIRKSQSLMPGAPPAPKMVQSPGKSPGLRKRLSLKKAGSESFLKNGNKSKSGLRGLARNFLGKSAYGAGGRTEKKSLLKDSEEDLEGSLMFNDFIHEEVVEDEEDGKSNGKGRRSKSSHDDDHSAGSYDDEFDDFVEKSRFSTRDLKLDDDFGVEDKPVDNSAAARLRLMAKMTSISKLETVSLTNTPNSKAKSVYSRKSTNTTDSLGGMTPTLLTPLTVKSATGLPIAPLPTTDSSEEWVAF